jgi:hypothetical protein
VKAPESHRTRIICSPILRRYIYLLVTALCQEIWQSIGLSFSSSRYGQVLFGESRGSYVLAYLLSWTRWYVVQLNSRLRSCCRSVSARSWPQSQSYERCRWQNRCSNAHQTVGCFDTRVLLSTSRWNYFESERSRPVNPNLICVVVVEASALVSRD